MKTAELLPPLLDLWVARAEGLTPYRDEPDAGYWLVDLPGNPAMIVGLKPKPPKPEMRYAPSSNGRDGQPIMERARISTIWEAEEGRWAASVGDYIPAFDRDPMHDYGPTQLIAAMRAYVASKMGEQVSDEAQP